MSKIVIEFDEEELKTLVAGIVAERVMNVLPMSSKQQTLCQCRSYNTLYEQ